MAFYQGSRGDDDFVGTAGNDTFRFARVHLNPGDRVDGGDGIDNVLLGAVGAGQPWDVGPADLVNMTGIETFTLSLNIGSFTLSDAVVAQSGGDRISVIGVPSRRGAQAFVADASALSSAYSLAFFAFAGDAHALGGAGNDTFRFYEELDARDVVDGGAGTDTLILTDVTQDAASLGGTSDIEAIYMGGAGAGVTLDDAFMARNGAGGRIEVKANAQVNAVDAAALAAGHAIDVSIYTGDVTATGGAGADIFRHVYGFGGIATINGGDGSAQDQLVLKAAADYGAGFFDTIGGIERIVLGTGGSSLVVTDALAASAWDYRLAVVGSAGDDVVDARGVGAGGHVDMVAGTGDDVLRGGAGDDSFHFSNGALTADDLVDGGAGYDRLILNGDGGVLGANVRNIESLALRQSYSSVVGDDFAAANPGQLKVRSLSPDGVVFDASAVTDTAFSFDAETVAGGLDALIGGAGADIVHARITDLDWADTILGGDGPSIDTLHFTTAGWLDPNTYLDGFEHIVLADGMNDIVLSSSLGATAYNKVLRVTGGSGYDKISGALLNDPGVRLELIAGDGGGELTGGAGDDVLDAGTGPSWLAGGAGADDYLLRTRDEWNAPTIVNFQRDDGDRLLVDRDVFAIDGDFDEMREDYYGNAWLGDADFVFVASTAGLSLGVSVMDYLRANGTGQAGGGMFVQFSDEYAAYLYHVTDRSGQSGDAALVAIFIDDGFQNPVDIDYMGFI